jgi:hypothetical protein
MNTGIEFASEDLGGSILPSQYNDLLRRRSTVADGEYRLLWTVLEDAIRSYLVNRGCSNPTQCRKFEEVRSWFEPANEPRGLFAFETICDLLGVDSGRLLKGLKSLDASDLLPRDGRVLRNAGPRSMAA